MSLATIFDLLAHHDRQDRSVEEQRIGAMVVTSDTMFSNESAALGRAAARHAVPAMGDAPVIPMLARHQEDCEKRTEASSRAAIDWR